MKRYFVSLLIVILLVSTLCVGAVTVAPQPVAAKTVPADMEVTWSSQDYAWHSSTNGVTTNAAAFPSTSTAVTSGYTKPTILVASAAENNPNIQTSIQATKKGQAGTASSSLAIYFSGWHTSPFTYAQVKNWPVQVQLRYAYKIHAHPTTVLFSPDSAQTRVTVNAKTTASSSSKLLVQNGVSTSIIVTLYGSSKSEITWGGLGYYQAVGWYKFSDLYKGTANEAAIITATLSSSATKSPKSSNALAYYTVNALTLTGIKIHFDPNYTPP